MKVLIRLQLIIVLLFSCAYSPVFAQDAPLSPFKVSYTLHKAGSLLGLAHYELSRIDKTWWKYTAKSEITGWLTYLIDADATEQSILRWNNGQLLVREYRYDQTGKEKHVKLTFDWEKHRVTNNIDGDIWKMNIPENTLDKLSVNLALMAHMKERQKKAVFSVADGGKLKTYHFDVTGKEMIETPLGYISCLKVRRNKVGRKNRETTIWLAPSLNYMIVKMTKKKDDDELMVLEIQSLN